jgi:predicted ATPase
MAAALAWHDEILRGAIGDAKGTIFSTAGDGFAAAFPTAGQAARAALEAQSRLSGPAWPSPGPLTVRMAVHAGPAERRDDNFFGPTLNRAARLMAAAHGGQVLCSQAAFDLLADGTDGNFALTDLGEHRLRDLARAERVYQLGASDGRQTFPALRTLDTYRTNLPPQMTAFIGREAEMASVREALDGARVVTITGVGGVGKTRLALQAAADVLPLFPGGAWLAELAGLADPDAVGEVVVSAIRAPRLSGADELDTLTSFLGPDRVLLVLDNCEHLVDAVAQFVEALCWRCPNLSLLCTSRETVGVPGERVVSLRPLPLPAEGADASVQVESEAVRLFIERARAARATFAVSAENLPAIAQICRRLDGVPLAIELAAARVRSMSPAEIAVRLGRRFQLLTGGSRGSTSRHQTLRGAIDWSYDLLQPDEVELLQRLSVCVGGFDLEAAEGIGSCAEVPKTVVLDVVDRLVDKSLVVADDLGSATRYRMLETIRDYGFEHLEASGRVYEVRLAHARHFADWSVVCGAGLRGPQERGWLELAERDMDNLRAAVTWALECGHSEGVLRVLEAMGLLTLRIEATVTAWATALAGIVRPQSSPDPPGDFKSIPDDRMAHVLSLVGWRAVRDGQLEEACRIASEAVALTEGGVSRGVRSAIAARCRVLATALPAAMYQGVTDLAASEEWVALATSLDDPYEEASALSVLAAERTVAGREDAIEAAEASLRAARRSGSPTVLCFALHCLGTALVRVDQARAIACHDESIAFAEAAGNDWAVSMVSASRAAVLFGLGDTSTASRVMLASTRRHSGNRSQLIMNLHILAAYLAYVGKKEPAAVLVGWVTTSNVAVSHNPELRPEFLEPLRSLSEAMAPVELDRLTERGRAMSDDEALEYAAAWIEGASDSDL